MGEDKREKAKEAQPTVARLGAAMSSSKTRPCPAARHSHVQQLDTNRRNNSQCNTDTEQKGFGIGIGL